MQIAAALRTQAESNLESFFMRSDVGRPALVREYLEAQRLAAELEGRLEEGENFEACSAREGCVDAYLHEGEHVSIDGKVLK